MNAKSFFSKIREIIREEIEYAIDKKINEQTIGKLIESNQKKDVVKRKKPVNSNSFSSIQDLLNETRNSLQESMEYDNEMTFTSDMVNGFSSRQPSGAIPNGYSKEDVPDEVMSALTKDYSALMKKIDEKKGR
jgi:hypothetical protein